jgi:hypothetical protein
MTTLNILNATPEQLDNFAKQCRLSANEKTALMALHSVSMFLEERDFYHVESNLRDAEAYATPRLKAMKKSVRGHLPYIREMTLAQHQAALENHFRAFCKAVRAS